MVVILLIFFFNRFLKKLCSNKFSKEYDKMLIIHGDDDRNINIYCISNNNVNNNSNYYYNLLSIISSLLSSHSLSTAPTLITN